MNQLKKIAILLFTPVLMVACQNKPKPAPVEELPTAQAAPQQPLKSVSLKISEPATEFSTDTANKILTEIIITYKEVGPHLVGYNNFAALTYAQKYAGQNTNSCGVYNNDPTKKLSDCAHFMAHCLKAGGITIAANTPDKNICPDGLSFKVMELTGALKKLAETNTNVTQTAIDKLLTGDYAFYNTLMYKPTHAFMICEPNANKDNIKIYAHSTNRPCEKPEPKWYNFFDISYHIADAPK